jgi:hypothetical protein
VCVCFPIFISPSEAVIQEPFVSVPKTIRLLFAKWEDFYFTLHLTCYPCKMVLVTMTPPLDNAARKQGGLNRDKGRPEWEKSFMGAVAGAARPLKNNHPAASDARQARILLKSEAVRFPWVILSIVGRDGRSVNSSHSDAEIEARVHQMGGALGLAGLILLRDRLATYARPFVSGLDVEERLTAAMENLKPTAFGILREDAAKGEEARKASPVSARVYTNGRLLSLFYSWETEESPEPGWELAGTVFLEKAPSGNWKAQTHVAAPKWTAIMEQAARSFESKMADVTKALSALETK